MTDDINPQDPLASKIHRVDGNNFDPESEEGKHAINMMVVALVTQKYGEETGEIKFGRPVKQLEIDLGEDIPQDSDTSMLEIQIEGRKARIRVVFFTDDREAKELDAIEKDLQERAAVQAAFSNVRNR